MALGRRCTGDSRGKNGAEDDLIGLGAVRATRGLGRKRVGISKEESCCGEFRPQLKRQCSEKFEFESGMSPLEALPQELLIRVFCGVEHDDLKQLMLVSKSVKEAALVAKKMHFEYRTPRKIKAFRNPVEINDLGEEIEAPNAPRQCRIGKCRISLKTKEDLAVALFQSDDDSDEEK